MWFLQAQPLIVAFICLWAHCRTASTTTMRTTITTTTIPTATATAAVQATTATNTTTSIRASSSDGTRASTSDHIFSSITSTSTSASTNFSTSASRRANPKVSFKFIFGSTSGTCSSGYTIIQSASVCQLAAAQLGYQYEWFSWARLPRGCKKFTMLSREVVYFNAIHMSSNHLANSVGVQTFSVCMQAPYITTTPTSLIWSLSTSRKFLRPATSAPKSNKRTADGYGILLSLAGIFSGCWVIGIFLYSCCYILHEHATSRFLVLAPHDEIVAIQEMFDKTLASRVTRDRVGNVPVRFMVAHVYKNMNMKMLSEYEKQCASIKARRAPNECLQFQSKTTIQGNMLSDGLEPECGETYLFHGTASQRALSIARDAFDMHYTGCNKGAMFGPGIYLAENSSKADEYADGDPFGGLHSIVVCKTALGKACFVEAPGDYKEKFSSGDYDCVIGDREKAVGTYREVILFRSEQVYPAYVVLYRRETE